MLIRLNDWSETLVNPDNISIVKKQWQTAMHGARLVIGYYDQACTLQYDDDQQMEKDHQRLIEIAGV